VETISEISLFTRARILSIYVPLGLVGCYSLWTRSVYLGKSFFKLFSGDVDNLTIRAEIGFRVRSVHALRDHGRCLSQSVIQRYSDVGDLFIESSLGGCTNVDLLNVDYNEYVEGKCEWRYASYR
jgi:hypothetical protein